WMWIVGLFGMAIKMTEVTLSMLYRNTADEDNPHGGPMWVVSKGLAMINPAWAGVGKTIGVIFCLTLLVSTATGGNMFQAWNVGEITEAYFGVPSWVCGVILAVLVGMVIIGGIKRIGRVAGVLVPLMVALYLVAAIYVLIVHAGELPGMLAMILKSAFSAQEATGAFIGGTVGYAFLIGMKRASFSNEAGQGSSPIAHSAVKTDEPVREGLVAGIEPFIDTIVVCTITALVILSTGVWNRGADFELSQMPAITAAADAGWELADSRIDPGAAEVATNVYLIAEAHPNGSTGNSLHKINGTVIESGGERVIDWEPFASPEQPRLRDGGVYVSYVGATLTALAFDSVAPGLGKWLVTVASWLFAVSTMISWSYYGEQGVVYLAGERAVLAYKLVFCALIIVATLGMIETDRDLDNMTGIGTGVMLFANLPILWIFGRQAMRAYHEYIGRLKAGQMGPDHPAPSLEDLISGKDVKRD
ncbi:MAG: amino acid carrier protein, partial [Pseudomonadota bacterium]